MNASRVGLEDLSDGELQNGMARLLGDLDLLDVLLGLPGDSAG